MRDGKNKGLWLLGTGLILALLGLIRGEAGAVLDKGISLCLQCMGLG